MTVTVGYSHRSLFKGAAVLVSGNALAQSLPLLAMPALTRLFDAHAFALYALLASGAGLLGGVSALRFDVAVSVAKDASDAATLWFLSLFAIVGVGITLGVIGCIAPAALGDMGLGPLGADWAWVLVAGAAMGIVQLNNYWMLRVSETRGVAMTKLVTSLSFTVVALVIGWTASGPRGLMLAYAFATLIGALVSLMIGRRKASVGAYPSLARVRDAVRRFRDFPAYGAVPAVLDAASGLIPLFVISASFPVIYGGQFGLIRQAVVAPLSLIAMGVGQVLLRHIADHHHRGLDIVGPLKAVALVLGAVAVPAALFFIFLGGDAFALLFGARWRDAGHMAAVLAIPICLRMVVSGLSVTLQALRRLKWVAVWQVMYFVAIVLIAVPYGWTFEQFLVVYAVVDTIAYVVYGVMIVVGVRRSRVRMPSS